MPAEFLAPVDAATGNAEMKSSIPERKVGWS